MCRWLAYTGEPIHLESLIFSPEHSLIDQSLSARSGETTNGDGFGIGWYGDRPEPGVFKDIRPAWNDPNLRDLSAQIRSGLFLAHVRSATPGLAIQRSNCHPFRHRRWLLVHNGSIRGFRDIRRTLLQQIDDRLFPEIEGTTDSELFFFLALHFGLEDEPLEALARATGFVETVGRRAGVEHPITMTLGVSNGLELWGVRYSSESSSRTLFSNDHVGALLDLQQNPPSFDASARLLVSEPLTDLSDGWTPVEEATAVRIAGGRTEILPFRPRPPGDA